MAQKKAEEISKHLTGKDPPATLIVRVGKSIEYNNGGPVSGTPPRRRRRPPAPARWRSAPRKHDQSANVEKLDSHARQRPPTPE